MLFKYYLNVIQAQMFRSIQMILIELTVLGYGTLIITRGGRESIIVKFRSLKARRFYKSRSRYHTDDSKKPRFSISVDVIYW